tara:strand:+ start:5150 stop:5977 length:828 start_codon:yes stop_codon:yes gene_type:complete
MVKKDKTLEPEVKVPKKRGRKPKGGKIIQKIESHKNVIVPEPNIILHLKCNINTLENNSSEEIETYNFEDDTQYHNLNQTKKHDTSSEQDETSKIWDKLTQLSINLQTNNITDKRSACFWCTYDFDNPPIYIPKFELNNTYQCYGCFCSPECSVSYLFNEHIDISTRIERYSLLNHIYCKIYNYDKNIKPAPNPYYLLEKYNGNLTIQEYRRMLKNERLLLIVDKPLSRVLPELHEDNDDFLLSKKTIPSSNKYTLRKKDTITKKDILTDKFNIK